MPRPASRASRSAPAVGFTTAPNVGFSAPADRRHDPRPRTAADAASSASTSRRRSRLHHGSGVLHRWRRVRRGRQRHHVPTNIGTVSLTSPGSLYITAPTVAVTGGGGSGATTTLAATGGVGAVNVTTGGSYTTPPTVSFGGGGGGTGAAATVTALADRRGAERMTNGGFCIAPTRVPTVTFTSVNGAGSGAAGTSPSVTSRVAGVCVDNPGSGYTLPPTVSFGETPVHGSAVTRLQPTASSTVTVTNPGSATRPRRECPSTAAAVPAARRQTRCSAARVQPDAVQRLRVHRPQPSVSPAAVRRWRAGDRVGDALADERRLRGPDVRRFRLHRRLRPWGSSGRRRRRSRRDSGVHGVCRQRHREHGRLRICDGAERDLHPWRRRLAPRPRRRSSGPAWQASP